MRKTSAPAVVYLYTLVAVAAGTAYVTLRVADRWPPRHTGGLDAETIAAARTIARSLIS